MPVYISLLRGINVGGNKKLPMADLRALYGTLGLKDTKTLLQSGNAVFMADETDKLALGRRIEAGIEERFGFHSDVFIIDENHIRAAVGDCPFGEEELEEPSKCLIQFLAPRPEAMDVAAFMAGFEGEENLYFRGDLLYMFFPDGMGKSKFDQQKLNRALKVSATGRNWNTATKLLALVEELAG
ncbi:MAG: DUF1697 domain-containing protein [Alphaproteobacteria bacterium]|nr:MAG: DUF1697 domain-containing protein [Alphaproteobacteria bacterium]